MMIRVNSEYLEFNDDIEIERQVKLFEEISNTDGDYSYDFELQNTNHNRRVLGFPVPDNDSKMVYQKVDADLLNDDGDKIYSGFIRIERINTETIICSFFSGNTNWFGLLSGPLTDIDFSDLDVDQDVSNFIVYSAHSDGIVFPLVDTGVLITRGYRHFNLEDLVAAIYVKTVFKRIFQHHSIKIEGDLLNDPLYNTIITMSNNKSQEQIDASSCYVENQFGVGRPGENVRYAASFTNDTVYPYYDGSNNAWDTSVSKYTAPTRMRIHVEVMFVPAIVDASYNNRIYLYINGAFTFVDVGLDAGGLYNSATPGSSDQFTLDRIIDLNEGDTLEIYTEWQQSTGSTQNDVLRGWVKITPLYIYRVYGNTVIPRKWSQQQYVSNVLKLFNVITHYDHITKTLTFNFFDKIKSKPSIDISEYVTDIDADYVDFISNYGKRNLLSYNEVDFDDLRQYNVLNFFKYGQGSIDVNNQFLDDSKSIIESDFSNPIGYINPIFDMSMERLNLVEAQTGESIECTSVTEDLTPWALFNIPKDIFLDGDLVRITDSTNPVYNGDWIIETRASGYIQVYGLPFDTDAIATITKLTITYSSTDDVYLLVNIPDYSVPKFSQNTQIRFDNFNFDSMPVAFFNLLNNGLTINDEYKQSLSFGGTSDPLSYQRTLIDSYWNVVFKILNDPVKLFTIVNLPYKKFLDIDFQQPITIRSIDTANQYYPNRITGYQSSAKEATIELIKLP